ncbi:hypothetical protein BX600DRAFT_477146 [Xylariales sp. PMI_506]|nr:hypothetical protein BX600DRAFT_477146 [Xylariales sp. PMI_506]
MSTIFQRAECVYAYLTSDESVAPEQRNGIAPVKFGQLAYWKRMWIVPEIIISRDVRFVFGSIFRSYDELSRTISSANYENIAPLLQLWAHREQRFGSTGRLEYLLWLYHDRECSDIRDRIFSLLCIAQDECLVDNAASYNCSLYDLWCRTIHRLYKGEPLSNPFNKSMDRRVRIVGQAALVQKTLDGDLPPAYPGKAGQSEKGRDITDAGDTPGADVVRRYEVIATGMVAGTVKFVGPTHIACLSSRKEEQLWSSGWRKCASGYDEKQKETLQRTEHEYTSGLLSSPSARFERIKAFQKTWSFAIGHSNPNEPADGLRPERLRGPEAMSAKQGDLSVEQRPGPDAGARKCFLESSAHVGEFGLVPFNTKPGDMIIAFWNCDKPIVVRPMDGWFGLVGPADIPSKWSRNRTHTLDAVSSYMEGDPSESSALQRNPIEVYFDMETLRILSA